MPDMKIRPQTTFDQIRQNFEELGPKMGGKHLRMNDDRGMHLHDTGKFSGIGAKAAQQRAQKHENAFQAVIKSIDKQLGSKGMGEQILRNVLSKHDFDNKLISVDDLKLIGEEMDRLPKETTQSIMGSLGARISDPFMLQAIEKRLKTLDTPTLIQLDRMVANSGSDERLDARALDALLHDLDDPDKGLLQTLAGHGLCETRLKTETFGDIHVARGDDPQGLRYDEVTQGSKRVVGKHYETDSFRGFVTCKNVEKNKLEDSGQRRMTGDKVHLSVDPKKVGQSWDLVMPILMKYPDVVQEFKVSDMDLMRGEMQVAREKLKELENAPPNPNETDNEKSNRLNTIANLKSRITSGERVTQGAQITIYFHGDGNGKVQHERARQMMDEIEDVLRKNDVAPGDLPGSDHKVNDFSSYRWAKRENGGDLDPDDKDYELLKPKMVEQPLFQALTK